MAQAHRGNSPPRHQLRGTVTLASTVRARRAPQAAILTTTNSPLRGAPAHRVSSRSGNKKFARSFAPRRHEVVGSATTLRPEAAPFGTDAPRTPICDAQPRQAAHERCTARYRGCGANRRGPRHPRGRRNAPYLGRCAHALVAMHRRIGRAPRGAWRVLDVARGTLRGVQTRRGASAGTGLSARMQAAGSAAGCVRRGLHVLRRVVDNGQAQGLARCEVQGV